MASKTQSELECTVCVELFRNPRILPCGHSFCLRCLEKLVSLSQSVSQSVGCPICRAVHQIPCGGVSNFLVNYSLQSLADEAAKSRQQKEIRAKEKQKCVNHAETKAVLFCIRCEQAVCPHCWVKHHSCETIANQPALVPLEVVKAELTNELASLQDKVARQLADLQDIGGTPDDIKKLELAQKAAADEFTRIVNSLEGQLYKLKQRVFDYSRAFHEEVCARHHLVKFHLNTLQHCFNCFSSCQSENLSDISGCLKLKRDLMEKLESCQKYCQNQQSPQQIVRKFEKDAAVIRTSLDEIVKMMIHVTL